MANIPRYTDDELSNKGKEVDFDLRKVFDIPTIEQLIYSTLTLINAGKILFLNTQVFILIIAKKLMLFYLLIL